jgi:hypothetical protein
MTAVIICAMSFDPDNPFPGTRAKIDRAREQMDGLKETRLQGRTQPPNGTPRFLPASCRHAPALFRAFVQVEGDPPRPRRRERAAGGPPTWSSDRGIASESDGWRRIGCHRRGSGPSWVPSRERNGTRRDRTRAPQREARSKTQGDRRRAKTRAARVTRRGAAISPRRGGASGMHEVHASEAEQLKTVGARKPHRRLRSGAGRATSGRKGHVPDYERRRRPEPGS